MEVWWQLHTKSTKEGKDPLACSPEQPMIHFAIHIVRHMTLADDRDIRSTVIGNEANSKISITIYLGDNHLPVRI